MTVGTIEKRARRTASMPAKPVAASRGWIWALVQLGVLGAEIFATLLLLAQPAFRPHQVQLTGIRHVTSSQATAALGLEQERNIFFLNRADLERRLEALPWVKSASVTLALPDWVSIRVVEWTPSAVLQVGESSYYLNDRGQILDPATEAGALPVIDRPDFGAAKSGQNAIASDLLPMLLQLRKGFAPAFRVSLMSFELDGRDVLSVRTDRGYTVVFGQMVTSDDRASLEPKLAALRALGSRIDLTSSQIAYINLENPGAPAVQMRGKR